MSSAPKKRPKSAVSRAELDNLLRQAQEDRVLAAELTELICQLRTLTTQVRQQARVLRFERTLR